MVIFVAVNSYIKTISDQTVNILCILNNFLLVFSRYLARIGNIRKWIDCFV